MQATVKTVRKIVHSLCNLEGSPLYRRQWADRARDPAVRNMAFRFWSKEEADRVARELEQRLAQAGYTNPVRRTDVAASWQAHTEGGHYVRLQALVQ
jgi:hypothetical protein